MKLKATLAALLFCATALASSPHKYRLVWQDDFNGTTFDSRSWTKISRGAPDWRKYMSDADSLYAVRDGKLVLRGAVNTNLEADTARFVTGGLYTKRKHAVRYGKVEVRARLDCAQGVWPAIWMKPDYEIKWPHGGEIDIMEHLNHDTIAYQTLHADSEAEKEPASRRHASYQARRLQHLRRGDSARLARVLNQRTAVVHISAR